MSPSPSSRHRDWVRQHTVYVGNLGIDATRRELESAFGKYGPLRNVWVARNPPGFAFVEFFDSRDAEEAVKCLDRTRCCGVRIIVEMSTGKRRSGKDSQRRNRYRSRSRSSSEKKCSSRSRSRSPRQRRLRSNSRHRR